MRRCDYHGHRRSRRRVLLPGRTRWGHACEECAARLERRGAEVRPPLDQGRLFPAA